MATKANDIQHGGSHYMSREYQHWDWVSDIGLPYLLGCATKYIARWRDKGGALDLQKAEHYLLKAKERGVESRPSWRGADSARFLAQFGLDESRIIMLALLGNYDGAVQELKLLLASAEA